MRIALCLTNHIRDFNQDIKNLIQTLMTGVDYHVYISTHTTLNRSDKTNFWGHDKRMSKEVIPHLFTGLPVMGIKITDDTDYSDRKCIVCKENVPKYAIDKCIDHDMGLTATHCDKCKTAGMVSANVDGYTWKLWRNVKSCYDMVKDYEIKNNIKYDVYIRSRLDLLLLDSIVWKSLQIPKGSIILGFGGTLGYPDDQFMLCSDENVWSAYCDIDHVLSNQLFAHDIIKDLLSRVVLYKFFQTARYFRDFNAETGLWDKPTVVYHDKRKYISDTSLL